MIEPYYERDGITIYCGDCREVLPQLGTFDLLLTDPPYGLERFQNGKPTRIAAKHGIDAAIDWDEKPEAELLARIIRMTSIAIIWGMNNFDLPATESFLVWDKYQTVDNFASAELAWTNTRQLAKVYRHPVRGCSKEHHPTQKPLPLRS